MSESSSAHEISARTFPHAMLREIYEQPAALTAVVDHYMMGGDLNPEPFLSVGQALRGRERLVIAASGSSRHAGLAAEVMLEDLAGVAVDVEYASEYCYRTTYTLQDPCVIVISQSGETADTLAALNEARSRGLSTIAVTNVVDSTMANAADASLPTCAGRELAIPATKSFTTQLATLYLLTLYVAGLRGQMTGEDVSNRCAELHAVIATLEGALPSWEEQIRQLVTRLEHTKTLLYLGRGIHYAIAREGALKLKESAYLQAEGYPAGELKHGPNALVSREAPLVVLATQNRHDPHSVWRYSKTLQLLRDMAAQNADIIALVSEGDHEVQQLTRHVIAVPQASEYLLPILEVVPLQMIAYFCAVHRGIDVDNPRNLVKAVVQE